jgi:hypothetical protein
MTEDALEREFDSIRKVFRELAESEKPLRIEWGTKKAFESQGFRSIAEIEERIRDHERLIEKSKGWDLSPAIYLFIAILEAEIAQLKWVIS